MLSNPYHHSTLGFLPEGGGKTRVIAIGDIFTQTELKPLHNWLMSCLRRLSRTDGTFDQRAQVDRIETVSRMGLEMFSFDLSACTDRFPVSFQCEVLSTLIGSELAGL